MAANVIMVVLLAVLTALTAALLLLEIRQSAARKLLITMAKRLERMERHMGAAKNETDVPEDDGKKKGAESPAGRGKENCDPSFLPFRGIGGKKTAAPTGGRVTWEDWRDSGSRNWSGGGRTESVVTKPAFVTGLKVSGVSYYNQREPVSLQELPRDEAVFHLYSDMTVRPDEKVFYVFNNSAFYINLDFTRLFDFLDQEGRPVDMQHPMKCLRVERPALVTGGMCHYRLLERGVLIVEEK